MRRCCVEGVAVRLSPGRSGVIRFPAILGLFAAAAFVHLSAASSGPMPVVPADELGRIPRVFPAEGFSSGNPLVSPLFFEGAPWRGQPTRVFAWLGLPKVPEGTRVPGVVLIHGGGGTAFASWVGLWVERGYAAIAFDTSGSLPQPEGDPRSRNPVGGPPGGSAVFAQLAEPLVDQWPFHALTAAVRAHSLLRAQPCVDPARTGVTGISWGGYLTCLFAGTDPRLSFAIPVYGCGDYGQTVFAAKLAGLPPSLSAFWREQWDASLYLPRARIPMLWVNGTNDHFFWIPAWQASHRMIDPGRRTLCLRVGMKHGHPPEGDPPEVVAFANSLVCGADPLPSVHSSSVDGGVFRALYSSPRPIQRLELIFCTDAESPWEKKAWQTQSLPIQGGKVEVPLVRGVRFCFLNVTDARGLVSSSEVFFLPAP
ncbi:MAG: acetylxylan esterase [Candidatus Methylacidiphilales bacterium]|nr:acetylxylan esterase [Candidatus Methylacidiphilales bacterium]